MTNITQNIDMHSYAPIGLYGTIFSVPPKARDFL